MKFLLINLIVGSSLFFSLTAQAGQLFCEAQCKNYPLKKDQFLLKMVEHVDVVETSRVGGPALESTPETTNSTPDKGWFTNLRFAHHPTTQSQGSWVDLDGFLDPERPFVTRVSVKALATNKYLVKVNGKLKNANPNGVSTEVSANSGKKKIKYDDGLGYILELECVVKNN